MKKKIKKILIILSSILIVLALFWVIVGAIKPYQVTENNPWRKEDRTLISAHRGGAFLNPENTEMAFDHVIIETDYTDIIEIDVRLTKDEQLVIIHDESINRTGIKGETDVVKIIDTNYSELTGYNLGVNFEDRSGNKPYDFAEEKTPEELKALGLSIMTLDEFLTNDEKRFLYNKVRDLHDNNWGIKNNKPVIIDYAMRLSMDT